MGLEIFFKNNIIRNIRKQYVEEFRVDNEIKLEPCEKFVACLSKLSKNYVLALRNTANIETLQVANKDDLEFFEGYEFANNFTIEARKRIATNIKNVYKIVHRIIVAINKLSQISNIKNRDFFRDVKVDFGEINNILQNIYSFVTMTDEKLNSEEVQIPADARELIEFIRQLMIQLINNIIMLYTMTIIEFLEKELESVLMRVLSYLYLFDEIVEN